MRRTTLRRPAPARPAQTPVISAGRISAAAIAPAAASRSEENAPSYPDRKGFAGPPRPSPMTAPFASSKTQSVFVPPPSNPRE